MPTITMLDGVDVNMFYRDHPPPHVHFFTVDYRISIAIGDLSILKRRGTVPGKRERIFKRWVVANRKCLQELWDEAFAGRSIEHGLGGSD